jgi:peptidoglycan hydrolase-like protein with peptidoglycan-binding domain
MAQFDVEIATPVLPITAASPDGDILRLQEWLVVRGISVGENPAAAPGSAAAVGIDGDFGPATQAGCATFAAAAGLPNATVDAAFWQALTNGMRSAFSFQAAQPTIADAVVETARAHLVQHPLEARRFIDGGLKGRDNSGPWVRAYCLGYSDQWCQGAASQWVKQAFTALGQPLPFPLDGDGISPLYVPSIVKSASRNSRLVPGSSPTPVPAGSFFFVRGMLDGSPSHIHVGVTISETRPDGRFDSIEGNTNLDGSQNGWEVCQRTRSRAGCDFGLLA